MNDIKLKLIIDILWREKLFFLLLFCSFFLFLFLIVLFKEPAYPISSSIIVEEKDNSVSAASITMLMSGQSQKILNEIEIMKSRETVDNIIDEFNLTYNIKRNNNTFINYILRVLSGKPAIEGSVYAEKIPENLKSEESVITVNGDNYKISNDTAETTCSFDISCEFMGGDIVLKKLGNISDNTTFSAKSVSFVEKRENLMSDVSFRTMGDTKESNTVQIIMNIGEPHLAVKIIEAFSNGYINKKISWNYEDADNQQKFMQKILDDVKEELYEKSNKLALYQKENQTVLPDLQFTEIMKRSVEIEKEIAVLKLQEEIVKKYEETIDTEGLDPIPAPVVIDDLSVQMLVQKHNELVARESELLAALTDSHPEILKTRTDIKLTKSGLKDLLKKTRTNYRKSIDILKSQSERILSTIEKLPQNLMNIATLQRDVLITEKLYAFLSQKIYEAGITQAMETAPIRVMDRPTHLVKKSFPSFSISFVIVIMLSLILSIFIFSLCQIKKKNILSAYEPKLIDKNDETVIILKNKNDNVSVDFLKSYISGNPSVKITTIVDTSSKKAGELNFLKDQMNNEKEYFVSNISVSDLLNESDVYQFENNDISNIEINSDFAGTFLSSEKFLTKVNEISKSGKKLILLVSAEDIEKLPLKFFNISESLFFLMKVGRSKRSNIRTMLNIFKEINGYLKIIIED